MMNEELKQLTEQLLENLDQERIKLGRIGSFRPQAVKQAYQAIADTLQLIEDYSENVEVLPGEQKREVAVNMLNAIIDIPFVPEFVEASIIGWSIDLSITLFNKMGGQAWLDVFFGAAAEEEVVQE